MPLVLVLLGEADKGELEATVLLSGGAAGAGRLETLLAG
jgi:hypothetical protein